MTAFERSPLQYVADRLLGSPRRLLSLAQAASLRLKITAMIVVLIMLLGGGLLLEIRAGLTAALSRQLDINGVALGHDLASDTTDLLLTKNTFALHALIAETLKNNSDVRYILLLDSSGQVVVHSFSHGVPRDLLGANQLDPGERYHVEIFQTEEGLIHDVAVPIMNGRAGTARIGMQETRIRTEVTALTQQVMATTVVVMLIVVLIASAGTAVFTQPLQALVHATRSVRKGDAAVQGLVRIGGEIGHLAGAFSEMVTDLRVSRAEVHRRTQELERRNQELSALNAIALAAGNAHELGDVLAAALTTTLRVMRLPAGWIFLTSAPGAMSTTDNSGTDEPKLELAMHEGLPPEFARAEAGQLLANCLCRHVFEKGQPMVVSDIARECRCISLALIKQAGLFCHASVPLQAKGRVLGVLNVAAGRGHVFSGKEMSLLSAIGNQIGVAVENARLWEEIKLKEAMRGNLLAKVISVQEEERRRIARELHDQTSQSLASLRVGLQNVQRARDPVELEQSVKALEDLTGSILDDLHLLARELRPSVLDDLGLAPALERYVAEYGQRFNISIDLETEGIVEHRLPPAVETALYRIIQEALTNVARHAAATNVSVLVRYNRGAVLAMVEDDGQGFDPGLREHAQSSDRHLGLFGMQERASLLGGTLLVESAVGRGTTIVVRVPIPEQT